KTDNVVVPGNLEKIRSANTPFDKVRKNLKNELLYQVISIIFIGFAPIILQFPAKIITLYYLLFSIFVAVCVYYLVKLYLFYKRLNNIALKTKDSLYEAYFDLRLNMELYKTFGFALTPFITLFMLGYAFYHTSQAQNITIETFDDDKWIGIFSAVALASILFLGLVLEWWVNRFYGKYAKEIKKVIDELKEE
ncbi:MAG TPA: hypothetical protein VFR70_00060, partial [Flavobacterium sp.]|nr:hypothetical protein [Flavobacterium sp.]